MAEHPLRIEINMQKILGAMVVFSTLFTAGFWIINQHDKYATKGNVNMIYIDIQIGLAEDKLLVYDEKDLLSEAQKRQYSSIQQRLSALNKDRDKIIGLGQ